jgi:hypothetical protein
VNTHVIREQCNNPRIACKILSMGLVFVPGNFSGREMTQVPRFKREIPRKPGNFTGFPAFSPSRCPRTFLTREIWKHYMSCFVVPLESNDSSSVALTLLCLRIQDYNFI